jgi:hypothetical protein
MRAPLVALALTLVTSTALAEDAASLAQAKTYFNAGAQAFEAGSFGAAIQAFEQAYKLAPKPAILFSLAQAHRRQYYLDRQPDHLREAIRLYRDYIGKVEQGGRRSDAAAALAELEPLAARLDPAPAAPAAATKAPTRIMVSSQTRGARVTLDGGGVSDAPLIGDVKPGKHTVRLDAPGFFPEEREVLAADGSLVAVDIPLRERPAKLAVEAATGAQISVDGRPAGTAPLSTPIELPPGRHFVSVLRNGSRAYGLDVDLGRGEERKLDVALETTGQRYASYALVTVGVAGLAVGGVFTGLALSAQRDAREISDARAAGNITAQQLADYGTALDHRDTWRRAAGVAYGAGAVVAATGLVLFAFDQPKLGPLARRDDAPRAPEPSAPPAPAPAIEMSAAPIVSPGFLGGALTGRF